MCGSVGALRWFACWLFGVTWCWWGLCLGVGWLRIGCQFVYFWLFVLVVFACGLICCLRLGWVRYGVWHGGGRYVNSVVFGFLVAVMYTCYCMFAAFCLGVSVAGCLFLIGVCFGVWFGFTVDLLVTVGFARFGDALWLFVVLFIGSVFVFLLDCAYGLWVICVVGLWLGCHRDGFRWI